VCYSNELKTAWADVPTEMIAAKGAVSPEVAAALAEGIRRHVGSTLGVGITGIAGPGGAPTKSLSAPFMWPFHMPAESKNVARASLATANRSAASLAARARTWCACIFST